MAAVLATISSSLNATSPLGESINDHGYIAFLKPSPRQFNFYAH
jgi:hypothetical protein